MAAHRCEASVHLGHKGPAIVWPFDPATVFGARPRQFVAGTINGVAFTGEIGFRRRVHYTLLDDDLMRAAGLTPNDVVKLAVSARAPTEADLASPANLVWARRAPAARAKKPRAP